MNYRLPFRIIDYRKRLYAETIVDYGWNGDDKNFAAVRRVLISYDGEMRPRPECVVLELPDQNHPALLLSNSPRLQALVAAVEAIEGGDCNKGSMNISGYHRRNRRALIREVNARPWLINEQQGKQHLFANKGVAVGDYDWLRIWRLLGSWNLKAFEEMERLGELALGELAAYYSSAFAIDDKTAKGWSQNSIYALKAAAALGAPERYQSLQPISARIENGTATAEDYLRLVEGVWRFSERTADENLAEALGFAIAAKADDAVIETLIAKGADVNYGDQTAVMRAIGDSQRLRFLLERGANPEKPNSYGKTPLMTAAHLNDLKSVRLLIDQSVDVNARTKVPTHDHCQGMIYLDRSALMYAAENASPRVIKILLKAGADGAAVDSRGRGMLDYLSRNKSLTDRQRVATSRALIEVGAKN